MWKDIVISELKFKAIRSSGPGGQHVNKTASKVEVSFDLLASNAFTIHEKERLKQKLFSRLSLDGILTLQCGETRSQHRNKAIVMERILDLLKQGLKVAKPRKKTKPSKSAIQKRLKSKKEQAIKKKYRRRPGLE